MKDLYQHDFSKIPVKGLVPESSATPPDDPADFQLWGDTVAGKAKWYVPGVGFLAFDEVADGAVTGPKVVDGSLPLAKLDTDPTDRANHHGTQTASSISDLASTVKGYRLDEFAAPAGPVDLGGQRLTNGSAPVAGTDYVTRSYLEAAISNAQSGIRGVKDPVRVVALTNVNLAAPGATIDGVTMAEGDRFLAAAQAVGTENGIYVYNGPSTPATRAPDADEAGEVVDGTVVAVAEGSQQGWRYMQQATPSGAPGAWTQQWTADQAGSTSYSAAPSGGLQLVGNAFSVMLADSSLEVSGSGLKVKLVPVAAGGTGATDAATARANLGAKGSYAGLVPALTAGVWTAITHGLGTEDITVSVRDAATKEGVGVGWRTAGPNAVELRTAVDVATDTLRLVVIG